MNGKMFFRFALALVLCMSLLVGMSFAETAAKPAYKIEVNGKNGTITRTNDTDVVYEDMYIRYSVGYEMAGTPYAVVATLKVKWAEGQEGEVGTFRILSVQGAGTVTGTSFIATTDENADSLGIGATIANSFGMLIK